MIAAANRISSLLDHRGEPLRVPQQKRQIIVQRGREIQARFDAAQTTDEFKNYWAASDGLDADSSHSKGVRQTLVKRSRYEVGNNGYADGMVQTNANFVSGLGPKLRMQTASKGFNQVVEKAWARWAKAVQLRRKLWCMAHAKVQDGEAFGVLRNNAKLRDRVKLDIVLFETEMCQTPHLPFQAAGYVDGIRYDEFGNPEYYDVLRYHPGGQWCGPLMTQEPEQIPAKYVMHWFMLRRPGQHRAVPEFRSTLNTGASSRRWREATVCAAESAADIALALTTNQTASGEADTADPYSTSQLQKRTIMAMPAGYDAKQITAEHPNAQYAEFNRSQINEQARPKNIPYNVAACDSSSYNYASGRLDHQTWFTAINIERADGDDLVLDVAFDLWFERAVLVYGWNAQGDTPEHSWDWPKHPVADQESEANAIDTRLKNGTLAISQAYSDAGEDFDDVVAQMAHDYGCTEQEMRQTLLKANFQAAFINAGSDGQKPKPEAANATA